MNLELGGEVALIVWFGSRFGIGFCLHLKNVLISELHSDFILEIVFVSEIAFSEITQSLQSKLVVKILNIRRKHRLPQYCHNMLIFCFGQIVTLTTGLNSLWFQLMAD